MTRPQTDSGHDPITTRIERNDRRRLAVVVAALTLTVAACGGGEPTEAEAGGGADDPEVALSSEVDTDDEETGAEVASDDADAPSEEDDGDQTPPTTSTTADGDPPPSSTTTEDTPGTDPTQASTSSTATDGEAASGAPGTVTVQLEDVEGYLIEGFEIGLRFTSASGEVVAATLWSDHIADNGDGTLDAWYETDLVQAVPPGTALVEASVNVGMGPAPVTPDLTGPLRCRLPVEVPADGAVVIEVSFEQTGCLRLL